MAKNHLVYHICLKKIYLLLSITDVYKFFYSAGYLDRPDLDAFHGQHKESCCVNQCLLLHQVDVAELFLIWIMQWVLYILFFIIGTNNDGFISYSLLYYLCFCKILFFAKYYLYYPNISDAICIAKEILLMPKKLNATECSLLQQRSC